MARLLLHKGADINRAARCRQTPLYIACRTGHVYAARLLLDKGVEVDRAMKDGRTPLYVACQNGNVDVVRLLLDKGAEVDRADKDGETPLDAAKEFDHDALVVLLEDSKFPLHAAARTGDVGAMRQIMDGGAEVDAKKDGATPIFVACEGGHVDAVGLLLERGAVSEHDSSALCEGDAVEVRYRGREKYYPGKISRDRGEGKYDIAYDDGDGERGVDARLIRKLPLSPLAIAKEKGHAAVVALLEEHQK